MYGTARGTLPKVAKPAAPPGKWANVNRSALPIRSLTDPTEVEFCLTLLLGMLVPSPNFKLATTCGNRVCSLSPNFFNLLAQCTRFYNNMGGRGNPGRSRGMPRGRSSPGGDRGGRGGFRGGDRGGRGGDFRGRGDGSFRGRGRGAGPPPPPLASLGAAAQSAEEQTRMAQLEKSIVRFKGLPHSDGHPLRPGFGSLGAKILLRANFFQVRFQKGLIIHDYDVKITPTTDIARLKGRVFELLERKAEFQKFKPYIAHDRSQRLVCPRELPQPLSFDIPYIEEEETTARPKAKTYTVEITKTAELHTDEMTK